MIEVIQADALEYLKKQPTDRFDAVIVDPPYFRVKSEEWDRKWDSAQEFLAWIDELALEWQRVMKPNGSLYCFASQQLQAHVEVTLAQRFNVLNNIVWVKSEGHYKGANVGTLRGYFPQTERIIFAEQFGQEQTAKGEHTERFVFEPIRKYLHDEMVRAGWSRVMVNNRWREDGVGTGIIAGHWFGQSQWSLPTRENYEWLRSIFNEEVPGKLKLQYEDLKLQYEALKLQYESMRRTYNQDSGGPYTDVWNFKPVMSYKGKHPCEKPSDLMEHIIARSTRPGDLVLDCFSGSGATGKACQKLGRSCVLVDNDPVWCGKLTDHFKVGGK